MSGEPLVYSKLGNLNYGTGCLLIRRFKKGTRWDAFGCGTAQGYICERRDMSVTRNQQRFKMKLGNSIPILESVIDDVTAGTPIRCASLCLFHPECVSFAYQSVDRRCVIANSRDWTNVEAQGFRHYLLIE
ncbi:uncharacterized protein LOC121409396 [Lytechinus variegatus]|uniref:uncharacterized protein LOC121409396 n=1 Tax=Lytechinus variegatus TaxID=7654 RepID=UPI001BB230EE|nr:uncharacterized protein LOC121409396 [Lytechinus variegatus]